MYISIYLYRYNFLIFQMFSVLRLLFQIISEIDYLSIWYKITMLPLQNCGNIGRVHKLFKEYFIFILYYVSHHIKFSVKRSMHNIALLLEFSVLL